MFISPGLFFKKSATALVRFWVTGGTGSINSTTNWSLTSGGASGASVPIAGVNAIFNGNSGTGVVTINVSFACLNFDSTGFLGILAGSLGLNIGGSLTLGAGITRTFTSAITMSATTTGKTLTFNGKTLAGGLTFNGVGGGWTVVDNITSTGAITTTNGSPNFTGRTVACNSWNIGVSGTPIVTGLNVNNSANFQGGSLTYNNITTVITSSAVTLTGSNIFNNYSSTTAGFVQTNVTAGTTQTINGTYTLAGGNAFDLRYFVNSATSGTAANIVVNSTVSITNTDLQDMVYTGSVTPISAPGVGNGGRNSGVTFDAPKTVFWKHPGTASVTLLTNNCVTTTGGSTPTTQLIQDTINLDANSFSTTGRTVAMSTNSGRYPALNFTGTTNTPTFNVAASSLMYGSLTLISGMTLSGVGNITFASDKTMTLTTAGKTIPWGISVNAKNGSLTLQDNLATTSSQNVQNGIFDLNNKTITGSLGLTILATAEVYLGNATLTFAQEGTVFQVFAAAIVHTGTSVIKFTLALAGIGGAIFNGGGISGYSFWNATTGTGYATIGDGGNSFTQIQVDASRTQKFTAGTTNDVAAFVLGASAIIQSTTAAQATINNTSGIAFASVGTTVTNINCTGAGWVVTGGVNGGGNTGITFI